MAAPDDDPSPGNHPSARKVLVMVCVGLALLGVLVGVDHLIKPTPTNPELAKAMGIGG